MFAHILLAIGMVFSFWMAYGAYSYARSDESKQAARLYRAVDGTAAGWNAGAVFFTLIWFVAGLVCAYFLITI